MKLKKSTLLGLLSLMLLAQSVWGQELKKITGTISSDDDKLPMPAVSIIIKGSTTGTQTDADGKYSISAAEGTTLVLSYMGFITREIKVGNTNVINVALVSDSKKLGEVVVVGYGTQSKRKLTTAISKISGKDIGIQPVSTPGDAMAGLAPGVQVSSARGGLPGDAPVIRVRGVGSIGGGNDVLYVVDGYPLQNANNFAQINPSDIESMEILKDAASAAIYGSRAANGVVIVTTKRGKSGKTSFEFSANTGIQEVGKTYEMMNKDEYLDFAKRAAAIRGVQYPDIFNTPEKLSNTDWQDLIFRKAMSSNYQLTATGGTDNVRFLASGGLFKQDGVLKGTDYERFSMRLNLDANLSNKLKIGASMAPSYSQQNRMPASGQWNNSSDGNIGISLPNAMQNALLMPPIINVKNANGDYGQPNASLETSQYGFIQNNLYNPLASLELVTNRFRNFRMLGNTFLEWEALKNLKLKTALGSTFDMEDQHGYIPPTVSTNNASVANISTPVIGNIWGIERNRRDVDYVWENTVNYQFSFGKENQHNLSALLLFSAQKFNSKLVSTNGKSGTYGNAFITNPTASTDLQGGIGYDENAFLSYGSRISYDYQGKYLFSAAFRRDGSSKFGPNNRFSNFPSVSVAWRVIDEKFMDGLSNLLSDLKLRASYGETGNANIGSFTWANSMIANNYVFGSRNIGITQSGFSNYDLTWEKNKQKNVGLDLGLLKNKVSITADYYIKTTDGMLLNKDLPGIMGYTTSYLANVGSLENKGLELGLNTNLELGKVKWSSDYNFSTNENKVLSLGGPQYLAPQPAMFGWNNVYQIKVGESIGNMYGFVVEGVFKNDAELAKYPQWNGNGNQKGDWRIKDISGPNGVPDGKITEADRTKLGNAIPKYTFNTTQRFEYKGFDVVMMVGGVHGVNLLNGNYRQLYAAVGLGGNVNMPKDFVNNFYDPASPDRDVKYHRLAANTGVTMNNNATNYSVLDASYLRLRNFTIGYRIPSSALAHLKLASTRVYVSGQNLFTITKYPGMNPEASMYNAGSVSNNTTVTNSNGDSVFQPGVDQGSYPAVKTITLGLSVGF